MRKLSQCLKVLLFLLPIVYKSKSQEVRQSCYGQAGSPGGVHQVYSPSTMIAGKTTSGAPLPFTYNLDYAVTSFYPAISYAISILSHALQSSGSVVNIHIVPDHRGWTSSGGPLMETTTYTQHDFGIGWSATKYSQAEANFLWSQDHGGTGNNWSGYDMSIAVNLDAPWFLYSTGTCPSNAFDAGSVFIHEICHGLGFYSSTEEWAGVVTGISGGYYLPTVFDQYIDDQLTGFSATTCTGITPSPLRLVNAAAVPSTFSNYCKGLGGCYGYCSNTSNSLYFNGSASGYSTSLLYTPPTWVNGVSMSHLYEALPAGTYDNYDLLQPVILPGNQLVPSVIDLNILAVIGWNAVGTVGSAISIHDYATCSGSPTQVLDIGSNYYYCVNPGYEAMNWSSGTATLEYYAQDGLVSVTAPAIFSDVIRVFVPSLPSGHIWQRDINGNIPAVLTYKGCNTSGHCFTSSIGLGIKSAPLSTEMASNLINISNIGDCNSYRMSFYCPGATSYNLLYQHTTPSGGWSGWSTVSVPSTINEYDFVGLNEYENYNFTFEAVNSIGTAASYGTFCQHRCKSPLNMFPNPVSSLGSITLNSSPDFLIGSVTITSAVDPEITCILPFDGSINTVTVDLSGHSLPAGLYLVTMTDLQNSETASGILQIQP